MDILTKKMAQAKMLSEQLEFEITFIPGQVTEMDQYKCHHKYLGITTYGPNEASAIETAQIDACGMFLKEMSLAKRELENRTSP